MIEYFVTQEKTFIFVVNQKKMVVKEVELDREKLMQCGYSYQREVVQYLDYGDIGYFSLQELSNYLVEPIAEYLSNASLHIFCPSWLYSIMFHCMHYYWRVSPSLDTTLLHTHLAHLLCSISGQENGRLFNSASFGVVLKEDERMFGKESRNGIPSVKLSTLPKCNKANCPLKPRWERHIAFFMPWLLWHHWTLVIWYYLQWRQVWG